MKVLVMLSGGLDSTVLAEQALHDEELVATLFVDYGQPAAKQEKAAVVAWHLRHENRIRSRMSRVDLRGLEDMREPSGIPGPRVVPARNLVLAAMGVNLAMVVGARAVWIGANADDAHYRDCLPWFASQLSHLVTQAAFDVAVEYRYAGLTKAQIVTRGDELQVPLEQTWSCYAPRLNQPCGTCDACLARELALTGG